MQSVDSIPYTCYLCGGREYIRRDGCARDNPELYPLECVRCGLVQLSSFAHITDTFYQEARMHDKPPCDPELMRRQGLDDDTRRVRQWQDEIADKDVLDFGCGAGGFLIGARQVAATVVGIEPEARLQPYFAQNNLTVYPSVYACPEEKKFDVITLFHVLEHIPDPIAALCDLRTKLTGGGEL